eukprot:TRINITY_DN4476_c0_g6_i1.p1 TRINITY_DN4476_c0_g6~~TRINITY_DN4476_c0_g6_i1.p1  ORF type:complete len:589 (+),score=71.36 TRINITY_DN4476_c0_g6_i1:634-2400(+)
MDREKQDILDKEMGRLKEMGVFEKLPQECYSSAIVSFLFCVPKKDGGWRPILNFVPTNNHISKIHFKMDTVRDLKDILVKDDLMTKIDLKDAYLHLFFNKDFRKYCAFKWKGELWQFISMMFGHVHAPRWWTKVMKVVVKHLRRLGIRCVIYIDDLIILHGTVMAQARKEIDFVVETLLNLGLTINMKKSILKPTTRVVFLGFIIDSRLMKMFVPGPKIKEIRKMANKLMVEEKCTIRILSSFLGKISAAAEAVLPWRLQTRALLLDKHKMFRDKCNWDSTVHLSKDSIAELRFWTDCIQNFNGKDIKINQPNWITRSDSSGEGFGGTGPGWCLAGTWTPLQSQMHNNTLETLAACQTIRSFILQKKIENGTILHQSDNMVAVSYLSKQGGKKREISKPVQEIWELCLEKGIEIRAQHVPGDQMTKDCDFLSRMHKKQSEWMLPKETFLALEKMWGPFPVDLFATQFNNQIENFMSFWKDPKAIAQDALNQTWPQNSYAFPPFILTGRILRKIMEEQITIILITPLWESATWWPTIQNLAIDIPVRLPPTLWDLNKTLVWLKWPIIGWKESFFSEARATKALGLPPSV